jgi:alpha-N-acetylglucosaminidase
MMLNGINMALAMVGQEYVVRKFYEDQGLGREEINGFLGGPAFMPWQRMGNIQGSWGFDNDTLYKNDWIDAQWELQGRYVYVLIFLFPNESLACLALDTKNRSSFY